MTGRKHGPYTSITVAARQANLAAATVRRYIRRGLMGDPLSAEDVSELRRARRLTALGVNLAGGEIILRMRRQTLELQREIACLERLSSSPAASTQVSGTWVRWLPRHADDAWR